MRRLLLVCLAAFAFASGPAWSQQPSAPQFTQDVARALNAALPSRTVTVKRELELAVRHPDGSVTELSLRNRYHDYARDPKLLGVIVSDYVGTLSRQAVAGPTTEADRIVIVPVIKPRQWLDDNRQMLRERGIDQDFLIEDFNGDLIVVFAEDSRDRTRYLMSHENVGDRTDLRRRAVENLKGRLPKIEIRVHDDVFAMMTAGGDYEASLLLFDHIWSSGQIKFEGDIVVAVPAKDVLLVTSSRSAKGVEVVRNLAAHFAAQQRYTISDKLFVYRDGRFARFERD